LITQGFAYKATDGSVYFNIEKYRDFRPRVRQLVKLNFDEMRVGERVRTDEYAKESVADFALWKARLPEDARYSGQVPGGRRPAGTSSAAHEHEIGRPTFDLHLAARTSCSASEDEIAQSEARRAPPGRRFVKYWCTARIVGRGRNEQVARNFFTLRDLLLKALPDAKSATCC